MSGWKITNMQSGVSVEKRYHRFEEVLALSPASCAYQGLPAGVDPTAQAPDPDGDGCSLLWGDGFIGEEPHLLPGLPMLHPEWLPVLAAVRQHAGGEAQLRAILTLDLVRHGGSHTPPEWEEGELQFGWPTRRAAVGAHTLLEVRGRERARVYLAHDIPSEVQISQDVDQRLVTLTHTYALEPGGPVVALPPGLDEPELRLTLAALQRVSDEDITSPFSDDLGNDAYAEVLRDFYGCVLLDEGVPTDMEIDLFWNWERVACGLSEEEVRARVRPGARLALLKSALVQQEAQEDSPFRAIYLPYLRDRVARLSTHPDEHPGHHPAWRAEIPWADWPEEVQALYPNPRGEVL